MKRYLACDCGYVVESAEPAELVDRVRLHVRRAHGVDLSDEQILWLSRPVVCPPASSDASGEGEGQ